MLPEQLTEKAITERQRVKAKRDWFYLCGIQASYWAVMTMQSSFLVSFLSQNGYEPALIAAIVTLIALVNLVAQPIWGYFADSKFGIRKVMIICMAGTIPTLILMPVAAESVIAALVLNFSYALFNQPLQGLTDSLTNIAAWRNKYVVYGFTRGCGSLSAAIASLLVGRFLITVGIEKLFYINSGLTLIGLILLVFFTNTPYGMQQSDDAASTAALRKEKVSVRYAANILLQNKSYILIVIAIMLMNVGGRFAHLFVPILIDEFGGTSAHIGFALFLNCIFMAPCMIMHSFLIRKKVSNRYIMFLGGIFAAIRLVAMLFASNLNILVGVQIFQSFAYGLMHPATVQAISEVSPLNLRSTAISFAVAVQVVLSTLIGNNVGSALTGIVGYRNTSFIFIAITIGGIALYMYATNMNKNVEDIVADS